MNRCILLYAAVIIATTTANASTYVLDRDTVDINGTPIRIENVGRAPSQPR
jgi:hypothetical protein